MSTNYQRKLTREHAPPCRYCGLRLPERLWERGVCDFCVEAHLDDPNKFWAYNPETDIVPDARTYEKYGPYEPPPLSRLDSDTVAVKKELSYNEKNRKHFGDGRTFQRLRAKREAGKQ